ncbi:unnamed protein product [Musa banksii]
MGVTLSCPGEIHNSMNDRLEALIVRSLSFGDNVRSTLRSISFNGRDSKPANLKSLGPGKRLIEGSVSFNGRVMDPFHLDSDIAVKTAAPKQDVPAKIDHPKISRFSPLGKRSLESDLIGPGSPKHEAAVRLQKVYKSFRTRRQLADCAVLVEQSWWKLLDFALLKRSSVSFFDIEKQESAVSRWSRARTRAAKVGKGLSKDEKAQKLALQHWLEAIDPRHRYGHNLQFYYDCWLQRESMQPFFYWLDVGEGKEVNLEEQCTRSTLQQQCIKYLGPKERDAYEVIIEDGRFMYRKNRQVIDSSEGPKDAKWIFVLSTLKKLYVAQKKKGTFQHSSFLAGGATSAAGQLVLEKGVLKAVWPHSGHYRPTEENFQDFMSYLAEKNVDLTDVKRSPAEENQEEHCRRPGKHHSKLNVAEGNVSTKRETDADLEHEGGEHCGRPGKHHSKLNMAEGNVSTKPETDADLEHEEEEHCSRPGKHHSKLNMAEGNVSTKPETEADLSRASSTGNTSINNITTCEGVNLSRTVADPKPEGTLEVQQDHNLHKQQMTAEEHDMTRPENVCVEEQEEGGEAVISSELIRRRINSKKGINSYQLGKKLSFKWTTGAGPRIGCVRDYPSELQFRALEQVCLSPTGAGMSRLASPRTARCQSPLTQEKSLLKEVLQQSHMQMTQEKSLLKEVQQQSHMQMTQEKSLLKEVLQQSHMQDNGR